MPSVSFAQKNGFLALDFFPVEQAGRSFSQDAWNGRCFTFGQHVAKSLFVICGPSMCFIVTRTFLD